MTGNKQLLSQVSRNFTEHAHELTLEAIRPLSHLLAIFLDGDRACIKEPRSRR